MVMLPYPLSVNRMWRNFRGRMVMSAEGRAYKEQAAWLCKAACIRVLDGDVELFVTLHPKLTKSGKASATRIDLDNSLKVACDLLNGVGYRDDKQIVRIVAELGYAVDGGGMSIEVKGSGEK